MLDNKTITTGFVWVCLITSTLFLSFIPFVHANDPYAGLYELVNPPQPTVDSDKIEVVEMFWYTCPHCNYFEKHYLKNWLQTKPDYVEFIHMPAVFSYDQRIPLAKAYYVAEALDLLDKLHPRLFEAIHDHKHPINNEKTIKNFFVKQGVSEKDFKKVYHSFFVDMKMRRAKDMTARYGISSVPVTIINGKYRLTSEKAEGYVNMMKIFNYLIEKEYQLISKSIVESNH